MIREQEFPTLLAFHIEERPVRRRVYLTRMGTKIQQLDQLFLNRRCLRRDESRRLYEKKGRPRTAYPFVRLRTPVSVDYWPSRSLVRRAAGLSLVPLPDNLQSSRVPARVPGILEVLLCVVAFTVGSSCRCFLILVTDISSSPFPFDNFGCGVKNPAGSG